MSYKQAITAAMKNLAGDPLVRFYGYGLRRGRAMGTIAEAREDQIIETPVAENLMVGLALGAALTGLRPVVYFERADFLLCAADAIVNHLDKLARISRGQFTPGVIIRVTVGNRTKPLFTGPTHTQDFSDGFLAMLTHTDVMAPRSVDGMISAYEAAKNRQCAGLPTMVFEYKDLM